VQEALPSAECHGKAKYSAKGALPSAGHSSNTGTQQRFSVPRAGHLAKPDTQQRWPQVMAICLCRVSTVRHTTKILNFFNKFFVERLGFSTRQRNFLNYSQKKEIFLINSLLSALALALAKKIFIF